MRPIHPAIVPAFTFVEVRRTDSLAMPCVHRRHPGFLFSQQNDDLRLAESASFGRPPVARAGIFLLWRELGVMTMESDNPKKDRAMYLYLS